LHFLFISLLIPQLLFGWLVLTYFLRSQYAMAKSIIAFVTTLLLRYSGALNAVITIKIPVIKKKYPIILFMFLILLASSNNSFAFFCGTREIN